MINTTRNPRLKFVFPSMPVRKNPSKEPLKHIKDENIHYKHRNMKSTNNVQKCSKSSGINSEYPKITEKSKTQRNKLSCVQLSDHSQRLPLISYRQNDEQQSIVFKLPSNNSLAIEKDPLNRDLEIAYK